MTRLRPMALPFPDPSDPLDNLTPEDLHTAGLLEAAIEASNETLGRVRKYHRKSVEAYRVQSARNEALLRFHLRGGG